VIAYDLWPTLTGSEPLSAPLMRIQLWLWFVGMLILTLPWHLAGLLGMPRRMAYYDYTTAINAPTAWTVVASVIGGSLLVLSGVLFLYILARARTSQRSQPAYRFSEAAHEVARVPMALNGFAVWFGLMIALTLVNYGFPIWHLLQSQTSNVPAVYVGGAE